MLMRDMKLVGFRVPGVPRDETRGGLRHDVVDVRNARDAAVSGALERSRAGLLFDRTLRAAPARGAVLPVVEEALTAYKTSSAARSLASDDLRALEHRVRLRAIRREADARGRERVQKLNDMIDRMATSAARAPQGLAGFYSTAKDALERLDLPAKTVDGLRSRLPEIPIAALRALIARSPMAARALIKRREGPADRSFGVPAAALRVLAKDAKAAVETAEAAQSDERSVAATRARADALMLADDAERGEAPAREFYRGVRQPDGIRATPDVRKRSAAVRKRVTEQAQVAQAVREKLARGEAIDADHKDDVDGLDSYYQAGSDARATLEPVARDREDLTLVRLAGAMPRGMMRRVAEQLRGEDLDAAAAAAALVAAAEKADAKLVSRLDDSTLELARRIDAAVRAGLAGREAVRLLRESIDLSPAERKRREEEFYRVLDGEAIARAIEELFGVRLTAVET